MSLNAFTDTIPCVKLFQVPTIDSTCREEIQSGVRVTVRFTQLLVVSDCNPEPF